MKYLKRYSYYIKLIIYILVIAFILSIINMLFFIKEPLNKIISLISIIIYLLITNIKEGKKVFRNGYKWGLKKGIIVVFIFNIFSLLSLSFKLSINRLIYYSIIVITCILGYIIGINKKASK